MDGCLWDAGASQRPNRREKKAMEAQQLARVEFPGRKRYIGRPLIRNAAATTAAQAAAQPAAAVAAAVAAVVAAAATVAAAAAAEP